MEVQYQLKNLSNNQCGSWFFLLSCLLWSLRSHSKHTHTESLPGLSLPGLEKSPVFLIIILFFFSCKILEQNFVPRFLLLGAPHGSGHLCLQELEKWKICPKNPRRASAEDACGVQGGAGQGDGPSLPPEVALKKSLGSLLFWFDTRGLFRGSQGLRSRAGVGKKCPKIHLGLNATGSAGNSRVTTQSLLCWVQDSARKTGIGNKMTSSWIQRGAACIFFWISQFFGNWCPDYECASSGKRAPLARLGSGFGSNPTTKTALE